MWLQRLKRHVPEIPTSGVIPTVCAYHSPIIATELVTVPTAATRLIDVQPVKYTVNITYTSFSLSAYTLIGIIVVNNLTSLVD